jgi:hypothetical protein
MVCGHELERNCFEIMVDFSKEFNRGIAITVTFQDINQLRVEFWNHEVTDKQQRP